VREGVEMDVVSHDARKFFAMMLKRNGYVMEQLFSPLVLRTSSAHEELLDIGLRCLTRHQAHHYMGIAAPQWKLFSKEDPPRVKPLLYTFRVLLTGIHLMRTGVVEANLVTLNEAYGLPYLPELIARKLQGAEKGTIDRGEFDLYAAEYARLMTELEAAHAATTLRDQPEGQDALNDLLIRLRLGDRR
jgi:predicted nucleotidyltransferase